ncbi:MAG: DUF2752 domain-containing protein [Phycisphaerae bacterium]
MRADLIGLAPVARVANSPGVASARERVAAGAIAAGCVALLAVGAWLRPDPRGYGTHEQLGALPCGFFIVTGIPCPTCGMTTAFSNLVHGHVLAAVHAQPSGAVLAVLTVCGALVAGRQALTGRRVRLRWEWLGTPFGLALLAGLLFGGWGYKIATFLISHPH